MARLTYDSVEFKEMVSLAIDGALKADQQREFFSAINSCPLCLDAYYKEKGFKNFLNDKLNQKTCSPDLLMRIKSNINHDNRGNY